MKIVILSETSVRSYQWPTAQEHSMDSKNTLDRRTCGAEVFGPAEQLLCEPPGPWNRKPILAPPGALEGVFGDLKDANSILFPSYSNQGAAVVPPCS
jgi:hypothetical protein